MGPEVGERPDRRPHPLTAVDWSKVDAGLAAALAAEHPISHHAVFVHLDPGSDPDVLAELGVEVFGAGDLRTATLTAAEVDELSELACVSGLRLSRPLGLTGQD